jgi:hypothetical protein
MVVCAFEMSGESNIANIFAAFGRISRRDFIFREDGGIGTFRDTSPTVDAGIRINIDPGPFIKWLTGDHTFHRTNIDTTSITNA